MAQITWSFRALDNLADIYHYIDSEVYARRFVSKIVYDTRQIPEGKVIIVAVQHGARDMKSQAESWVL